MWTLRTYLSAAAAAGISLSIHVYKGLYMHRCIGLIRVGLYGIGYNYIIYNILYTIHVYTIIYRIIYPYVYTVKINL